MKKISFIVLISVLCACDRTIAPEIPAYEELAGGSKTDVVDRIDTLYYTTFNVGPTDIRDDYRTALASLQGLMNAIPGGNSIYVKPTSDYIWKNELGARYIKDYNKYRDLFRDAIRSSGVTTYVKKAPLTGDATLDDISTNIAASYASAFRSVILTDAMLTGSDADLFEGLTMAYDASDKDFNDVYDFFMAHKDMYCTDGVVSSATRLGQEVDLAIKHRWLCLHLHEDTNSKALAMSEKFFAQIDPCSPAFTFEGPYVDSERERKNIEVRSKYNLYCIPGGCFNISTHERGPVYHNDIAVNSRKFPVDYEARKHYVAIVMSDGDNIAYFDVGKFVKLYQHPYYGEVPLSFTMSGSLKTFKPVVEDWFYTHTHPTCSIGGALTGPGYIFPSCMTKQGREDYGRLTAELMQKEGQKIMTVMDTKVYNWNTTASYSEDIIKQLPSDTQGVIYFHHGVYDDGMGGAIYSYRGAHKLINGIPFVSARFEVNYVKSNQKDGDTYLYYPLDNDAGKQHSQRECAKMISDLTKKDSGVDPTSPDAYSIVLFCVNTTGKKFIDGQPHQDTMEDLKILVDYLADNPDVQLVNINQFFDRYKHCVTK